MTDFFGQIELLQQIIVAAVICLVFIAFFKELASPDLVAMGAFTALILLGILGGEALSVFSNPAPITVACMFMLSAALERTGVIEALGNGFQRMAGKSELRVLVVMMLLVAPLSAFVNNTPVVVVFMPIVLALCRKEEFQASRFLIPLSYAAIAGGTCTIIGTSTNLLASGIAAESGLPPFGMFEVAPLGILFVIVTTLYMTFFGKHLLPDRDTLSTLFDTEEGKEFLTQAYVSKGSPLIGKLLSETPLAKMKELRLIEAIRGTERVSKSLKKVRFQEGDQLLFKSRAGGIIGITETKGLEPWRGDELGLGSVKTESAVLMEGIIGPDSNLVGKSLKQLRFRQRFGSHHPRPPPSR